MFQIALAFSKSKYFAPKGHELCGSQVTNQSVDNLLCVHYVTILTYLCHLPQSIHRGFSTGLNCALVSILLPSSPILINGTKPQMFKIKRKSFIFPCKTRSRVLQEDVIPSRPPVPTRYELHIHLCSATCYSHLVRQVKWKRVIGEKVQIGSGCKWSLVSGRRSLLWR